MGLVLAIIAVQQGLFALGWWVAGRWLGLSRRAALHWEAATVAAALALALVLQRPQWSPWLTVFAANLLGVLAFVGARRGAQVFLDMPLTDGEHAVLLAALAAVLALAVLDPALGALVRCVASATMAWTLLRCAREVRRTLMAAGDDVAARIVAAPVALLGAMQAARGVLGLLQPEIAARPLEEANAFNAGLVLTFVAAGIVLNLVLAYLVANRLVRRLQRLSMRDPLTGLLNRRGLAPRLARESARWHRYREPYGLLAVDVDRFKDVNDRQGHAAGDAVLVQLGGLLRETARDVDAVARLGGEEFCVLLAHSDLQGAVHAAERLRERVAAADWSCVGWPITVSVGVAVVAGNDLPPEVLARADAALLRAKAGGRDRVVVSAEGV